MPYANAYFSHHISLILSLSLSLPQIFNARVFEGVNTSALRGAMCTRIKTVQVCSLSLCELPSLWLGGFSTYTQYVL